MVEPKVPLSGESDTHPSMRTHDRLAVEARATARMPKNSMADPSSSVARPLRIRMAPVPIDR